MGFFKFIKKILDTAKEIEEEKSAETVKTKELKNWLQVQRKNLSKEESEFLKQITSRITQLADELKKEVAEIQTINLADLKVEKRARLITGINIDKYTEHLQNLIETLQDLELTTTDGLMETLTTIFRDFDQKSKKNFQKAVFLAGHKLNDIGINIGRFFSDIRKLIKNNEALINRSKILAAVESEIQDIDELEKTKLEFVEKVGVHEQEITELKDKKKKLEAEIQTVKKSKAYARENQKREDLEKDKTQLTKSIYELGALIDFKLLANIFHSNPKKLTIVRYHKANFEEAFQQDSGKKLSSLLEEAEVNHRPILDRINKITETQQKIDSTVIEPDKIADLDNDITKINLQIEDINSKKELEQKKHNKFQTSREKLLDSIRDNLSKINVVLE